MRTTKFGHAGARLEKNGRAVVIDPGVMTADPDALTVVGAPTLLVPGQAPWLTVPT